MKIGIVSFAKRLKQVRKSLKLNQVNFAGKLNYPKQRISFVESEKRGVYFSWIEDVARKLDLIPVGFYYRDKKKWVLDTLDDKNFWKCILKNYVGKILLKHRIMEEMDQRILAKKIKKFPATISNYERGKSMPSSTNLEEICEIFNIVPYYLLERKVRFDKGDYKPFRKSVKILEEYYKLSYNPQEIRGIMSKARKIEKMNKLLEKKYNLLVGKVLYKR